MTGRRIIKIARHFSTVLGVLLAALVLVAWKHRTLDIASALKSSLLNTEVMLRSWFSSLRLH